MMSSENAASLRAFGQTPRPCFALYLNKGEFGYARQGLVTGDEDLTCARIDFQVAGLGPTL